MLGGDGTVSWTFWYLSITSRTRLGRPIIKEKHLCLFINNFTCATKGRFFSYRLTYSKRHKQSPKLRAQSLGAFRATKNKKNCDQTADTHFPKRIFGYDWFLISPHSIDRIRQTNAMQHIDFIYVYSISCKYLILAVERERKKSPLFGLQPGKTKYTSRRPLQKLLLSIQWTMASIDIHSEKATLCT